jgi:hypothetical protein
MSEEIKPIEEVEAAEIVRPELPPVPDEPAEPPAPSIQWHPLEESEDHSATINKRIRTHLEYRQKVENRTAGTEGSVLSRRQYSPEMAYHEALRRELFIRQDVAIELQKKNLDAEAHLVAFRAIMDELETIGGHCRPTGSISGVR